MKKPMLPDEEVGKGQDVKSTNMLSPNAVDRFKDGKNMTKPHSTSGGKGKGPYGGKGTQGTG